MLDLKLYKKVLEYSYQTLREAQAIGAESSVGVSYEHLANAYRGLQQKDSALYYFQQAVDISRRLDYKILLCSSLGNSADLLLERGQVTEALARYREAIDIAQRVDDPYQLMINLHGLSLLFFDQKDIPRAREYALLALDKAKGMVLNDYTYTIYLTLSDIALAQGDWERYAQYREEFYSLRDSLNNQSLVHAIQELETKYETEKKEQQIAQLEQAKAIDELKIRQKNGLIGGLGGLTALLLLTGSLGYRNLQNRRRIAEQEVLIQDQIIREMEQEKQLSTLDAMLQGQEEERGRLARDLHDGLGGMLSGIQQTLFQMKGNQILPETSAASLNQVIAHLDASISELRHIARNMMPEALVRFGLKDALQDYCDYMQETTELAIHFQSYGMEERLPQQTEVVLFRIVQELLNNVVKHAGATQAIVQLLRNENRLHLTVEDNGKGLDVVALEKAPGVGWVNIRSRVSYLNGILDLHSLPGTGTSVHIECPIGSTQD